MIKIEVPTFRSGFAMNTTVSHQDTTEAWSRWSVFLSSGLCDQFGTCSHTSWKNTLQAEMNWPLCLITQGTLAVMWPVFCSNIVWSIQFVLCNSQVKTLHLFSVLASKFDWVWNRKRSPEIGLNRQSSTICTIRQCCPGSQAVSQSLGFCPKMNNFKPLDESCNIFLQSESSYNSGDFSLL